MSEPEIIVQKATSWIVVQRQEIEALWHRDVIARAGLPEEP